MHCSVLYCFVLLYSTLLYSVLPTLPYPTLPYPDLPRSTPPIRVDVCIAVPGRLQHYLLLLHFLSSYTFLPIKPFLLSHLPSFPPCNSLLLFTGQVGHPSSSRWRARSVRSHRGSGQGQRAGKRLENRECSLVCECMGSRDSD